MKKKNNRFLAGTLAGLMMLTMLPVTALAAQEGADGNAASDTPNNNIVNVVSDGKNVQQAENNDVNITANGGTENTQKSADDSSDDTENAQKFADDSSGGSADTAAPAPQEGENSGSDSNGEPTPTPTPTPAVGSFVAKIVTETGIQTYDTLDAAIEAAESGAEIEIGNDEGVITVNEIRKNLVINGNGHTITIPDQEKTDHRSLNIYASLTFNNTKVKFVNNLDDTNVWSATVNANSVLTLDQGSICTMENHGIYAENGAIINVKGQSKLTVKNTTYTALMANKKFADFNIEEGSEVTVDHARHDDGIPNGINNFKIKVVNSTLTVTDCEKQGLVRCWLTLDNSNAEISGNGIGICGNNGTDVLIMKNGSNLTMEDNGTAGIFLWGGKVKVEAGNTLTITGTGKDIKEITDSRYDGALAVYYYYNTYTADVNFEDGATVNLIDNDVSAINNDGKVYIGNGTTIMNNGSKTVYGGGIQNRGDITIAPNVKLYNNHAKVAGDDIYNTTGTSANGLTSYTGSITFAPVGDGWILDDCKEEHPIVGWYHDGKEKLTDNAYKRWNGDGEGDAYYADEYTVGKEAVSDALALKAAHGQLCSVTYEVTGDIPSDAGAVPAAAKVKKGGSYTVAPVQTTSQSRYTFSGWRINGVGDVVTEIKDIQQDVKLIGVWTRRSSGGGGGSHKPTVTIPDDVPTGLNGDDHYAYIVGYPDSTVRPQNGITRAEVATIFFRLLTDETRNANSTKSNSYSDVAAGAWYNHAVSTLSAMGIVKGDSQGKFNPNAPITRAEFAAIAARFDDKANTTAVDFSDIASHWAKDEISAAANNGWINGYTDGTFRPNNKITRAEAMTLVNRVLKRLPETAEDLHNDMIKWSDNSDTSAWYYLAVQEATNSHYYGIKENKHEKWSKLRETRDWTELEK